MIGGMALLLGWGHPLNSVPLGGLAPLGAKIPSRGDMRKPKRKLTAAEKAEEKRRRQEYMTIFINGKQKRVRRPPTIDGMDVDEFIRRNADPIWLHQKEMWEYMEPISLKFRCLCYTGPSLSASRF